MANGSKAVGKERRREERLLVQDVLTGFLVAGNGDLIPIELNDISKNGISFLMHEKGATVERGQVAKLNLVFNDSKKYFQCFFQIRGIRRDVKNRYMLNGEITEDSMNKNAVGFLVRFIKAVRVAKFGKAD